MRGLALSAQLVLALLWPGALLAQSSEAGSGAGSTSSPAGAKSCTGRYSLFDPEPSSCVGPMATDRPHLTDSPRTVPAGHFQLETELFNLATSRQGRVDLPQRLVLMGFLARIGIVSGVDFQVGYVPVILDRGPAGWSAHTDSSVFVRTKLSLLGSEAPVGLTLAPILLLPTSSEVSTEGGLSVLFGVELPWKVEFEVNLVAITVPGDGAAHWWMFAPSAALTRQIYGPLSAFVETYHEIRTGGTDRSTWLVNGGLLLLLGRRMQLDAGARGAVIGPERPVSAFLGFSFLL